MPDVLMCKCKFFLKTIKSCYAFLFMRFSVYCLWICICGQSLSVLFIFVFFLVYNKFFKSVYNFCCCPVMVFSMCLATTYCQTCYDLYSLWDLTNLIYIWILLPVLNRVLCISRLRMVSMTETCSKTNKVCCGWQQCIC